MVSPSSIHHTQGRMSFSHTTCVQTRLYAHACVWSHTAASLALLILTRIPQHPSYGPLKDGKTALMVAVLEGKAECVETLIAGEADVNVGDNDKVRPSVN